MKPIAYDRNNKRQQLRLPSSVKKLIDHTQLHRSQSIRYNQYRSIKADPFVPSASCDRPREVDRFAPRASCDRSQGDKQQIVTSANITSQALLLRSAV
jgi:hypothetical protein